MEFGILCETNRYYGIVLLLYSHCAIHHYNVLLEGMQLVKMNYWGSQDDVIQAQVLSKGPRSCLARHAPEVWMDVPRSILNGQR